MRSLLTNLWNDQSGGLISMELVLVATILLLALVVGLGAVRDAVNLELADFGSAIGSLDQSFSVGGISSANASCSEQQFIDLLDSGDDPNQTQPAGANSRCVVLGGDFNGEQ